MPAYTGVLGDELRKMFQDVPLSLLPRPVRPARLTDEEARVNYRYAWDDKEPGDACELLHRVRRGVKPVATLVVRVKQDHFASEAQVLGAARGLGLRSCSLFCLGSCRFLLSLLVW